MGKSPGSLSASRRRKENCLSKHRPLLTTVSSTSPLGSHSMPSKQHIPMPCPISVFFSRGLVSLKGWGISL